MKVAKKVLSIILAVAMVLGTFAVAANAGGPGNESSEHYSKWTLRAETGYDISWKLSRGNVTGATIIDPAGDEVTPESGVIFANQKTGNIEVQPGDIVYVFLYVVGDFYSTIVETSIYFSAELGDTVSYYKECYDPATWTKAPETPSAAMAGYPVFANSEMHDWMYWYHADYFVKVPKILQTPTNIQKMYPVDADGKEIFPDHDAWNFMKFGTWPDISQGYMDKLTQTDECLWGFPVFVPKDAQPGDTYTVTIPEGAERTAKGTPQGNNYTRVGWNPENDDVFDDPNLCNFQFDDSVYIDLSDATITLTVPGTAEELNYSDLQTKYDAVKGLNASAYTPETWTPFKAALDAAATMLANKDAADQDAIDACLATLNNTYDNLKLASVSANYAALDAAIAAANGKVQSSYTTATWTPFATALAAAKAVDRGLTSDKQNIIDDATAALVTATNNLALKASYTALDAAIAAAPDYAEDYYTPVTWSTYAQALANAQAVDRDLPASQQSVIDGLTNALATAKAGLQLAPADYTKLNAAIARYEGLDSSDYTGTSWAPAMTAYNEALLVSKSLNKTQQGVIDSAEAKLTKALNELVSLGGANYTALDAAIAEYEATEKGNYTDATWAAYTTAYEAAKNLPRDLKETEQNQVDAKTTALNNAKAALLKYANYTELDKAIAQASALKETDYTTTSWAMFSAYLQAAKNVARNLDETKQTTIDEAAADLIQAIADLEKYADYTKLDAAIKEAEELNGDDYPASKWEAVETALAAARAVNRTLGETQQATVDAAETALRNALAGLTGFANYAALDSKIAEFDALTEAWWTAGTWATAKAAADEARALDRGLSSDDQAKVDAAATKLDNAIKALVEADADYTAVEAAKAAAQAKIDKMNQGKYSYTDESRADAQEAIDAVVYGKKAKDQALVDAMAAAINEAADAMQFRPFDYTQTLAYIADWESRNEADYTPESWAEAKDKFDNVVFTHTYDITSYRDGMLQQIALKNALAGLVSVTVENADYTDLDEAIRTANALSKNAYTADSWADLVTALTAANNVPRDLTAADQATVDAAKDALLDAIDALVKVADYTALDAAIAQAETKNEDDYSPETWAPFANALADAYDVDRDLTEADQDVIDAATKALKNAMAALKPALADYTAYDEILEEVDALEASAYTPDSWANLVAAVEPALARNLTKSQQSVVDNKVAAIRAAIDELELRVVEGNITNITWTPASDTHNTFTVTVNGRPSMIQFIEPSGGTRTYTRYNPNVTIVSYDAEGNVVNSLDRSLAYEVWTIYANIPADMDIRTRAKYAVTGWETETYDFRVALIAPTYEDDIISAELAVTEGGLGKVKSTVVTGKDAKGVRFAMEDGSTCTYSLDAATVNEDGTLTFVGNSWMNHEGLNVITVYVRGADSQWKPVTTTLEYNAVV